jgi:transposase
VDRKTIRRYAEGAANSPTPATGSGADPVQIPPPRPPALGEGAEPGKTVSACEPHRSWIEAQVQLGRNAVSVYQDLVEREGFPHGYNSVKRFVAKLRDRDPERFDVLEFLPGEESQVDLGQGAPTLTASGRYRRPHLFVMTLKYSGKSFRKTAWKMDQETWCRLHEEAWRSFGGCVQYEVIDNLKQGVLTPDLYDPELNPLFAAVLAHYGVVADPCRVADPDRKGTVENAIQHTQGTALKGRRFETIEDQNAWLTHWEERWAAPRIHGRKKRQVLEMFREEQPHLRSLPLEAFRYFKQETRTVDDAGLIQVAGSYYAAIPAPLFSRVQVRIYAGEIEILDPSGAVLRRHAKAAAKGRFVLEEGDRIFNPSRQTARLLEKAARIGPKTEELGRMLFATRGRPGHKALYGLTNLPRTFRCEDIEMVSARFLEAQCFSFRAIRKTLQRRADAAADPKPILAQDGPEIRAITEYQDFWNIHGQIQPLEAGCAPEA